jgi:hypothetical protein
MAYDGWIDYNGRELVNVARTARLARAMGLNTVRIRRELIETIEDRLLGDGFGLGGFGLPPFGAFPEAGSDLPDGGPEAVYSDITYAPWYDAGFPASWEFAGIVPLSFRGLDDSTLSAEITEYITDGGHSGRARNETLSIVANVALVGTTERGVEFGKRWMNEVLRNCGSPVLCTGADLTYLRYLADDAPIVHRRDVQLTRGSSVTRKKVSRCSSTWLATFTLTAGDPYEYGSYVSQITSLGGPEATGPQVESEGTVDLEEITCPVYDYSPIYDPLYPALVPSPTAPDFQPDGWAIEEGMDFRRYWARLNPVEPSDLTVAPMIVLRSSVDARMVRVSIWPSEASEEEQCGPLFNAILMYLPEDTDFYLDGKQQAAYVWDGSAASVRRSDSLVYGEDAVPVRWESFNDEGGLLVTLDVFDLEDTGYYEGDGTLRVSLDFVSKSD